MLVLSRQKQEAIIVADTIRIIVLSIKGSVVRLGFDAPEEIIIHRRELYEKLLAAGEAPQGTLIRVTIVRLRGDKVRIGIAAPAEIPVHRQEVAESIAAENAALALQPPEPIPADDDPLAVTEDDSPADEVEPVEEFDEELGLLVFGRKLKAEVIILLPNHAPVAAIAS